MDSKFVLISLIWPLVTKDPPFNVHMVNIFDNTLYVQYRNETVSTFLNSSWKSGHVNLIFLPDLAGEVN